MNVFVFFKEIVEDGIEMSNTRIFSNKEKALREFNDWKDEQILYAEEDDWTIDNGETSFEAFEDGDFYDNHVIGHIEEIELED